MKTANLFERLGGGDLRSIGRADEVAKLAAMRPETFAQLVDGLSHEDARIRMRCADAIEKASAQSPKMLLAFGEIILTIAETVTAKEVRWHMAQLLPRLSLDDHGCERALTILRRYLSDPSRIVVVNALEALTRFSEKDLSLWPEVDKLLRDCSERGSPAVKAKARKLLSQTSHRARG